MKLDISLWKIKLRYFLSPHFHGKFSVSFSDLRFFCLATEKIDSFSLYICVLFVILPALPNQQTVDYPSFKLVIIGDGGTCIFWIYYLLRSVVFDEM